MTSTQLTTDTMPEAKAKQSFIREHGQKIAAALIWGGLALAFFINARASDMTFSEAFVNALQATVDLFRHPVYGPLVYIGMYILRPVLLFPATIITLIGGSIYGLVMGVVWVVIGSNLSALLAYGIGRFFGDGVLEDDGSDGLVQRYARRMRSNSFETVLIMRFIYAPYDLVNYMAGFLKIKWIPFILATALGSIPGTLSFVAFGASVSVDQIFSGEVPTPNAWTLAFSVVTFIISLALSRYFKRREAAQS